MSIAEIALEAAVLRLNLEDRQREYLDYDLFLVELPPITVNGQQVRRIKVKVESATHLVVVPQGQPTDDRLSDLYGEYIMLEVP